MATGVEEGTVLAPRVNGVFVQLASGGTVFAGSGLFVRTPPGSTVLLATVDGKRFVIGRARGKR